LTEEPAPRDQTHFTQGDHDVQAPARQQGSEETEEGAGADPTGDARRLDPARTGRGATSVQEVTPTVIEPVQPADLRSVR